MAGGVCQTTVWKYIHKVTDVLLTLKEDYIKMPSREMLEDTARRMLQKYHIRDLGFGVDGMMVYFDGAPKNLPAGFRAQHFWSRKEKYALNVQVETINEI